MQNGRFVTLEGGEGVGKSTLAQLLKVRLSEHGINVVLTREPGGSIGGEEIRSLVLNPKSDDGWSALTQTLLFFAARSDHLDKIIAPALKRGDWVICDRFTDSTRAYQQVAGGVSSEIIEQLDQISVGDVQPDMTLILDMPVEDAVKRREARNGPMDAFESKPLSFHKSVREAFRNLGETYSTRCHVLDAGQSPDEVLNQALKIIDERFDLH
ncbi:dTMP kinase [Hirschia maritima]|uniref:dTMP kinase n=1 Tax=Hirschia maritima TaxID=1121961 RepID=UPI00037287F8|nr:dTMP kinase [Hirschia maritima]